MTRTANYLALDLGAESGRGLIGGFDGERLSLEEVSRFPNGPVRMLETLYWDLPRLWDGCRSALGKAKEAIGQLEGIGVDTWGVDFALLGRGNTLLGNPVHYRDGRTAGMIERACQKLPRECIYEITGLQFMPFNTVFQLFSLAQSNSPLLEMAETLLMMPDVLNWLLTGQRACERTDASTTQLLDPTRGAWSDEICASLGIPRHILGDFVEPGTSLGPLHGRLAEETGLDPATTVYATAGHDTAAAVAAVPAKSRGANGPDWCYISSGTWSLMGVESPKPIINKATFDANFTNEGGVLGTTRILKNIMGLWLVQECRRAWERAGREFSYEDLTNRASAAEPFAAFVDPDDSTFLEPGDMPARLLAYCGRTGQRAPADEGGLVRCALESLAFKYRYVLDRLESIVGNRLETIHIVGGGTRNTLLCQFTADACGRPVLAGPIEATAMGNILMQLVGTRKVGSLADGREIVARSFPVTPYEPTDVGRWDHAYGRFLSVTGLNLK